MKNTSKLLQSGIPDFYKQDMAYHPVKNEYLSFTTVLWNAKVVVKNCLLAIVLSFLQVKSHLFEP